MVRSKGKGVAGAKEERPLALSDEDIYEAMREISGFIDITAEDFREVYLHAFRHATEKMRPQEEAPAAGRGAGGGISGALRAYFSRMRGSAKAPARVGGAEVLWSWVGAFLGILSVSFVNYQVLAGSDLVMMIGSFGASAVLIYGAVKSPLAQPRNLLGGHILSALVGVFLFRVLPNPIWLTTALAVATAIALMHLTGTLHPPGGATALIAVIGSERIHQLGYLYALIPAGLGALMMLVVALLVNNLAVSRRYPEYWM